MYDVVVVGAGPAGLAAGIAARQFGADVLIIEQGKPHSASGPTPIVLMSFRVLAGEVSILMESSHSTLLPQPSGQFGPKSPFLPLDISGSAKFCPLKV